jgi:hypothetical protein
LLDKLEIRFKKTISLTTMEKIETISGNKAHWQQDSYLTSNTTKYYVINKVGGWGPRIGTFDYAVMNTVHNGVS